MLSFNKQGTTRLVILTKRYVIKIPAFYPNGWYNGVQGIAASICEKRFYEYSKIKDSANEEFSKMLMPILWSWAGLILIQPRGYPVLIKEYENWSLFLKYENKFNDAHHENVVWHEGEIKVCDYG